MTGPRRCYLSEQERNSGLGGASSSADLPRCVQRPDAEQMKIQRGVTFKLAIFLLCLAQIFPTIVFLTTQALRGRPHTALRSGEMNCGTGVDSSLQGHLAHPTPSLNLSGNHEPERGRESPTVTWLTAEPDTLSSAPLSHGK